MSALSITLLAGLSILVTISTVQAVLIDRWYRLLRKGEELLDLPEGPEEDDLILKHCIKINKSAHLANRLLPVSDQVRYLFLPTVILFVISLFL